MGGLGYTCRSRLGRHNLAKAPRSSERRNVGTERQGILEEPRRRRNAANNGAVWAKLHWPSACRLPVLDRVSYPIHAAALGGVTAEPVDGRDVGLLSVPAEEHVGHRCSSTSLGATPVWPSNGSILRSNSLWSVPYLAGIVRLRLGHVSIVERV